MNDNKTNNNYAHLTEPEIINQDSQIPNNLDNQELPIYEENQTIPNQDQEHIPHEEILPEAKENQTIIMPQTLSDELNFDIPDSIYQEALNKENPTPIAADTQPNHNHIPPAANIPQLKQPIPRNVTSSYRQAGHNYYAPPTAKTTTNTQNPNPAEKASVSWQNSSPPKTKPKRINISRKALAAVIAITLTFACLLGFGGGMLAIHIADNDQQAIAEAPATVLQEPNNNPETSLNNTNSLVNSDQANIVSQVALKASPSVVEIMTEGETTFNSFFGASSYLVTGAGSGVIISNDGYIITNNHVIEDTTSIQVTLYDGQVYDATLQATDPQTDIAIIKIEADNLIPAEIGDSDALTLGEPAIVIGNPLGHLGGSVTSGVISSLDREITFNEENGQTSTLNVLQTDASINGGNSGGGLFNQNGELVAIVVAKQGGDDVEGLGFAIPINDIKTVIDDLINYGYARGRVALGVSLLTIADERTAMSYRVDELGVYILQIEDDSNAQRAGLKVGDRIVSINNTPIEDATAIQDIVAETDAGQILTITYSRGGEQFTIDVLMQETIPENAMTTDALSFPE